MQTMDGDTVRRRMLLMLHTAYFTFTFPAFFFAGHFDVP